MWLSISGYADSSTSQDELDPITEQQTEESNVSESEEETKKEDAAPKAGRLKWIKDDRLGKGEVHKLVEVQFLRLSITP